MKAKTSKNTDTNGIFSNLMTPAQIAEGRKEVEEGTVTEDGGLGDLGRKLQEKIDSGEINNMTNKEIMDSYLEIVALLGNEKLLQKTKLSLLKKNRGQLIDLCRYAATTAIKSSKQ